MKKKDIPLYIMLVSVLIVIGVAYGQSQKGASEVKKPQKMTPEEMATLGVPNLLTEKQVKQLTDKGWSDHIVYTSFAPFGIDADQIEALKETGINFDKAQEQAGTQEPYLWAKSDLVAYMSAAADDVVTGEVKKVLNTEEGPYHTEVFVNVDKSFKDDLTGRTISVRLLFSGTRAGEQGDRIRVRANFEPQFKEGERVLLFLTATPRALQGVYALARKRGQAKDPKFVRNFGNQESIERTLQDQSYYEVQRAYKIVGDKAVLKSEALHATNTTHELNLSDTAEIARKVHAAETKVGKKKAPPRIQTQIPQ